MTANTASRDLSREAGAGGVVSVIIPTYNRRPLLERALESARAQDYPDKEIIVVDDGSTDDTADLVPTHPDVLWVRQANRGPSAARNLGLTRASGEFLAFLDSDDFWLPGFLTASVGALVRSPEAGFAFANWRIVDQEEKTLTADAFSERAGLMAQLDMESAAWQLIDAAAARDLFIRKSFIMPSGIVFRGSRFAHRWDESLTIGEDQLFILQGLFAGEFPLLASPEILWAYRFHDSNHCTNHPDKIGQSRGEIRVKERLLNQYGPLLTVGQARALSRSIAASCFDLGFHARAAGHRLAAMRAFGNAWRRNKDLRTLVALFRSLLP